MQRREEEAGSLGETTMSLPPSCGPSIKFEQVGWDGREPRKHTSRRMWIDQSLYVCGRWSCRFARRTVRLGARSNHHLRQEDGLGCLACSSVSASSLILWGYASEPTLPRHLSNLAVSNAGRLSFSMRRPPHLRLLTSLLPPTPHAPFRYGPLFRFEGRRLPGLDLSVVGVFGVVGSGR